MRLVILPILAVTFAKAFADRPRPSLCLLLFLTSMPIYIEFHGRDAMVLTTALIGVAYAVAIQRRMLRHIPYVTWPTAILLFLYLLGTAGTWATPAWNSSVRMVLGVVAAFMFGHLIYSLVNSESAVWQILKVLAAMLILQAAVAVIETAYPGHALSVLQVFASRNGTIGPVLVGGADRATGTLGDYELLSEWFAGALPVFICLLIFSRGARRLWGAALAACLVGILVTVTRGGVVAGVLGVVTLLVLVAVKRAEYGLRVFAVTCCRCGCPADTLTGRAAEREVNVGQIRRCRRASTFGSQPHGRSQQGWSNLPPEALALLRLAMAFRPEHSWGCMVGTSFPAANSVV